MGALTAAAVMLTTIGLSPCRTFGICWRVTASPARFISRKAKRPTTPFQIVEIAGEFVVGYDG